MSWLSKSVFAIVVLLSACSQEDSNGNFQIFTKSFDFSQEQHSWEHGFAQYPANYNDSMRYELQYSFTQEPTSLVDSKKAIMLSGRNNGANLFMFIKRKIEGLSPNTDYTLTFEVELASDAQSGVTGSGTASGANVYLKVGATDIEPRPVIEKNLYVMNIDKGVGKADGEDMICIGNIAVTNSDAGYSLITLSNTTYNGAPFMAKTNSKGELYLIVGTESNAIGKTTLFYTKVNVVFSVS